MAFASRILSKSKQLYTVQTILPKDNVIPVCYFAKEAAPKGLKGDVEGSNYYRRFSSRSFSSNVVDDSQIPAPIDYRSMLQEDEFHRLADSTIHHLLEKLEEYGDSVEIDGFDVDYGSEVLTLKLGNLGTYVVNRQTPNRQIWLSSPVSGPSRYDWDSNAQAWVYRRNKANLLGILESELEQLCGESVNLS